MLADTPTILFVSAPGPTPLAGARLLAPCATAGSPPLDDTANPAPKGMSNRPTWLPTP
jgi:hypothetical protein